MNFAHSILAKQPVRKLFKCAALGMTLGLAGCGATLSDFGFIGTDSSLDQRFAAVCLDAQAIIYKDVTNGDRFKVIVSGERSATVYGRTQDGSVTFSGLYNGQNRNFLDGRSAMGVTLWGVDRSGSAAGQPSDSDIMLRKIRPAAFKALADAYINEMPSLPPCAAPAYSGPSAMHF